VRIFTAVRHSIDPSQFYGRLWSSNFYPALEQLGHEVIESQVDLLPASRFMQHGSDFTAQELEVRSRITGQILDEVREAHRTRPIDVFLGYFYNSHFDPAAYDVLRQLGIPSINYYCNSIYQFGLVSAIAAKADWSWHAERDARASYLAAGARPVWVQMAADPSVYHPVAVAAREQKACFVGQRYADRDLLAAALIQGGVRVDLYGRGWSAPPATGNSAADTAPEYYLGRRSNTPGTAGGYIDAVRDTMSAYGPVGGTRQLVNRLRHQRTSRSISHLLQHSAKGPVDSMQLATVFGQYELCLSFSNVWADGRPGSALIPHVRLRDFEGPMSRVCYLTGDTDEIREFYEVGLEIDTYTSAEELVDKARFYLAHPAAAERLRDAGYQRALRDHTWARRFEELFTKTQLVS
jgi:spore maturation protein CgeB